MIMEQIKTGVLVRAYLVIHDGERVLVVAEKNQKGKIIYGPIGGQGEEQETRKQCLAREIKEECGETLLDNEVVKETLEDETWSESPS